MSTQKGGVKKGPPKHQNVVAWKPNRALKKKDSELGSKSRPYSKIFNVCNHCYEQIEWKRKYGKYKTITEPSKCTNCSKRNVRQAYHKLCEGCAKLRNVCAKCCKPSSNIILNEEPTEDERKKLEEAIKNLRERERRTILREMSKGPNANKQKIEEKKIKGKRQDDDDDDDDEDDDDEDDDNEDDEDDDNEDDDDDEDDGDDNEDDGEDVKVNDSGDGNDAKFKKKNDNDEDDNNDDDDDDDGDGDNDDDGDNNGNDDNGDDDDDTEKQARIMHSK